MVQHVTPSTATTVDERVAAPYLGYTTSALRAWRHQGRGPAYIRIGRSVRYRLADLDAYLAAHRVEPRNPQEAA